MHHCEFEVGGIKGEAVKDACGQRRRNCDKRENQRPVVRTAAWDDRRDGEPGVPSLRRHSATDQTARRRRQRGDEEARNDSDDKTQPR
jgi:hypothetical protein